MGLKDKCSEKCENLRNICTKNIGDEDKCESMVDSNCEKDCENNKLCTNCFTYVNNCINFTKDRRKCEKYINLECTKICKIK